MVASPPAAVGRHGHLTAERIVDAAIELLDSGGAGALTFRLLAQHLGTGHGALQWHVGRREELVLLATLRVLDLQFEPDRPGGGSPRDEIVAVALDVLDVVDAHPWVAEQLARPPWQASTLRVFELVGQHVARLVLTAAEQFATASALMHYLLGALQSDAALSLSPLVTRTRADALDEQARRWEALPAAEYPFMHTMAEPLRSHHDRELYVAGIDLVLAGIGASTAAPAAGPPHR